MSELSPLRPRSVPPPYFETIHWVAQPGLGFTLLLRENLGSPASASQVAGIAGLHSQTGHIWVSVGLWVCGEGGWWTLGLIVPPGPPPSTVTLKIVKKDEFSTKCNQTDHHRMSGGRQEVSPGVREGASGKMFSWLVACSRGH